MSANLLMRHDAPLLTPRRVPSRRKPVTACLVCPRNSATSSGFIMYGYAPRASTYSFSGSSPWRAPTSMLTRFSMAISFV